MYSCYYFISSYCGRRERLMLRRISTLVLLLVFMAVLSTGCLLDFSNTGKTTGPAATNTPAITVDTTDAATIATTAPPATEDPTAEPTPTPTVETVGSISVHFIDVGQGDSILIKAGSAAMLIDAGNPGDADTILDYLRDQGVSHLNYLIGTHPHADHIGSMAEVIDALSIGAILMPNTINNTETFENLLDAVDRKGLAVTAPKVGSEYDLANAKFTIIAPNGSGYADLNDNSIVIRLVFGETSFLFTGDAEAESESEMLAGGYDLESMLLKVGHHGSNSSSTSTFLTAVHPKYAVISVGNGNTYGHPTAKTLSRFASAGVLIYRTDLAGTIVATSDGSNIVLDKDASPIKTAAPPTVKPTVKPTIKPTAKPAVKATPRPTNKVFTVYITKTGEKYHKGGCRYLSKSKIAINLRDAISQGYTPCKVCKPPTR
jgi:competence protein ComEC